jgi:leader peptidase (prepilin peptidase)/N-methyltransferase
MKSINILSVYVFLFGSLIGSFLNVIIYRLPRNEDFVYKRSACTHCGYQIPWYLNIPLLGFIIIKGKCRSCGVKVSYRYFIVELVAAIMAVYLFPENLGYKELAFYLVNYATFCILLCHFWIDVDHHILPNSLNLYLLFISLPLIFFYGNILFSLIGLLVGLFIPGLVAYIFYKIKGVEGLGMGDIKLYGILGLLLGAEGVSLNIFLSCFLGAFTFIILQALKKVDRNTPIAFGPFIIVVAFIQLFFPHYFKLISSVII